MINTNSEHTVNNWLKLLSIASEELSRLNLISEKDFIKIGEDFQSFYYRSKEISKLSTSISEILTGNEIKSTIENLKTLLDELNHFSKESDGLSEKAEETLQQIRDSINEIYNQLDGFKRSVKHLNILGISIRIEDANLSTERNEFHILAEEVTKLGEVIRHKLDITSKKSVELDKAILATLGNVAKLKNSQSSRSDSIINNINNSLNELLAKQSNSFELAKEISDSSDKILKQTGDIVTAIQFHDITRQQIEHVIKAFDEVANNVQEELKIEHKDEKCNVLGLMKDVCQVQNGQIEQAGRSIYSASENIRQGLKGLEQMTEAFTIETEKLAGISGDSNFSVLSEIEEKIKNVNNSLKENADSNQNLVNAVSSSVGTIEQISSYLNDIKNTGMDIEMISLNAIIKTAKLGTQGAALSVLASSIRDLSIETADQIKNIDGTIGGITQISQDLSQGINQKTGENVKEIEAMTNELEQLIEIASTANKKILNMLNQLKREGELLRRDIAASLSSLNIEEQFNYSFNIVSQNLSSILDSVQQFSKENICDNSKRELKILEHNYTMQSEREVHKKALTSDTQQITSRTNGENTDNNIEFF